MILLLFPPPAIKFFATQMQRWSDEKLSKILWPMPGVSLFREPTETAFRFDTRGVRLSD
jgi:hypothetical protein